MVGFDFATNKDFVYIPDDEGAQHTTLDSFVPLSYDSYDGGSLYLDISPTNERAPSDGEPDYTFSSILSRLVSKEKLILDVKLHDDIKKLSSRIYKLKKSIEHITDKSKLISYQTRLEALKKEADYLYNASKNSLNLYADRYIANVPDGYLRLAQLLGFKSEDLSLSLWFNSYTLNLEFGDGSSASHKVAFPSKVYSGRYHPAKGISKGMREAKRVAKDLLVLSEILNSSPDFVREGNGIVPFRQFVLTAPKPLSFAIWDDIVNLLPENPTAEDLRKAPLHSDLFKTFEKTASKTIKDFLSYLADKHNISSKHLLPAFLLNIHPTGDKNPFEPHFHAHVMVIFLFYDKSSKKFLTINPYLEKEDLDKLREIWKTTLLKAFPDVLEGEKDKDFNVYTSKNYHLLPLDLGTFVFELRYNSRKMFVNLANYYDDHDFEPSDIDFTFLHFLFAYENKTKRYGFLTHVKHYLTPLLSDFVNNHISNLEFERDKLEYMLSDIDPKAFPLLASSLKEKLDKVTEELQFFTSHLDDLTSILDYLSDKVSERLTNENLKKERILSYFTHLYKTLDKEVKAHSFTLTGEDMLLSDLIENTEHILLVGDRHKTMDFYLFTNPSYEPQPDVVEIIVEPDIHDRGDRYG